MKRSFKNFWGRITIGVVALTLAIGAFTPVIANAEEVTFDIPAFSKAPKIDGTVSSDEWGSPVLTVKKGEPNVYVYEEKGALEDFSADIYLGYDKKNIYIAAVAKYANHKNETLKTGDLWLGDCMQIQISDTLGRNRNELNFAVNSVNNNSMMDKPYGVGENTMKADKDYKIVRSGDTTTYEIALNIKQFSAKLDELTSGTKIPFSVAFHENGGAFIEYCDGIVNKKDIALAAVATLTGNPVDAKDADTSDNSTSSVNDGSNETNKGVNPVIIVIPCVAVVAIAAVIIVFKKKSKKS